MRVYIISYNFQVVFIFYQILATEYTKYVQSDYCDGQIVCPHFTWHKFLIISLLSLLCLINHIIKLYFLDNNDLVHIFSCLKNELKCLVRVHLVETKHQLTRRKFERTVNTCLHSSLYLGLFLGKVNIKRLYLSHRKQVYNSNVHSLSLIKSHISYQRFQLGYILKIFDIVQLQHLILVRFYGK